MLTKLLMAQRICGVKAPAVEKYFRVPKKWGLGGLELGTSTSGGTTGAGLASRHCC